MDWREHAQDLQAARGDSASWPGVREVREADPAPGGALEPVEERGLPQPRPEDRGPGRAGGGQEGPRRWGIIQEEEEETR